MTEETSFRRRQSARLMRIRELSASVSGPVRIMCIVVDAREGVATVQDIMDELGKAATIEAIVEGVLQVGQKYILIGQVTERKSKGGTVLGLDVSLVQNINALDIKEFKEALKLEQSVLQAIAK